jgi:hypothetical protein
MGSKRSQKQAVLQQQGGKGNIRRAPGKMVNAKAQGKGR